MDRDNIALDTTSLIDELKQVERSLTHIKRGFASFANIGAFATKKAINDSFQSILIETKKYCKIIQQSKDDLLPLLVAGGRVIHELKIVINGDLNEVESAVNAEHLKMLFTVADLQIIHGSRFVEILYLLKPFKVFIDLGKSIDNAFQKTLLAYTFLSYSEHVDKNGNDDFYNHVEKLNLLNERWFGELRKLGDEYSKMKSIHDNYVNSIQEKFHSVTTGKSCFKFKFMKKWIDKRNSKISIPMDHYYSIEFLKAKCKKGCICNQFNKNIQKLQFLTELQMSCINYFLFPSKNIFEKLEALKTSSDYKDILAEQKEQLDLYDRRFKISPEIMAQKDKEYSIAVMNICSIKFGESIQPKSSTENFILTNRTKNDSNEENMEENSAGFLRNTLFGMDQKVRIANEAQSNIQMQPPFNPTYGQNMKNCAPVPTSHETPNQPNLYGPLNEMLGQMAKVAEQPHVNHSILDAIQNFKS